MRPYETKSTLVLKNDLKKSIEKMQKSRKKTGEKSMIAKIKMLKAELARRYRNAVTDYHNAVMEIKYILN